MCQLGSDAVCTGHAASAPARTQQVPPLCAASRRRRLQPATALLRLARCRLQDKKDKGEKKEKKDKSEKKDKDKSEKKDKSERCRGGGGRLAARRQRLQCAAARCPAHPRHLQSS